jgi:ADP-dependent NAD(P)H-hydrate dehydratase / NAD(P)H-hydrate epimerase
MDALPVEVYSAAAVRAMDRHAIERAGIPGYTLMQRAGSAAFDAVKRHWPAAARIAVLCGGGNNAGDGYVFARRARAAGLAVSVSALGDPGCLSGDASLAWRDFAADGGSAGAFDADAVDGADLIVDALLGTGVSRPVDGVLRDCIERVNRAGCPVLALDIPSGLDADSGLPHGAAIRATRTLGFVALKSGYFLGAAPDHVGALELADLGVAADVRDTETPVLRRMSGSLAAAALPARRRSAHKGEHGRVLVVGGFVMAGAARLAGESALRTGAGLVTVATGEEDIEAIVAARPELIARPAASGSNLKWLLAAADAVAIGPGLGTGREAHDAFDAAVASDRPLVVDADALNLLAADPRRRADWILTPHPGEAARLLGCEAAAVQRDRLASARAIAERFGGVCVLKGAHTLVQGPERPPWVCDRGNPGMATAGSGDVLTGIVAALLAGGAPPPLAAAAGVLLHAEAGDRAARAGERGVIAGDLVAELRGVVNSPWS